MATFKSLSDVCALNIIYTYDIWQKVWQNKQQQQGVEQVEFLKACREGIRREEGAN